MLSPELGYNIQTHTIIYNGNYNQTTISSTLVKDEIGDNDAHTCLWCRIEINGRPLPVQSNLLCILREMRYFGLPNCSASPPPANFTLLCANPVGDVVPTVLTIQSRATTLFLSTTNDSVVESAGLGVLVVLIVLTIIIILLVGIIVFQFQRNLRGMLQPSGKNEAKGNHISGECTVLYKFEVIT